MKNIINSIINFFRNEKTANEEIIPYNIFKNPSKNIEDAIKLDYIEDAIEYDLLEVLKIIAPYRDDIKVNVTKKLSDEKEYDDVVGRYYRPTIVHTNYKVKGNSPLLSVREETKFSKNDWTIAYAILNLEYIKDWLVNNWDKVSSKVKDLAFNSYGYEASLGY